MTMLSFICSACGGFGHTPEDSLDSGTTLTCDGCGAKTIVELFSPDGYKKRHEMERYMKEVRPIAEAALAFVRAHGSDHRLGEGYIKLFSMAGNYLVGLETKKSEGNPWAPNKDYPGKPIQPERRGQVEFGEGDC